MKKYILLALGLLGYAGALSAQPVNLNQHEIEHYAQRQAARQLELTAQYTMAESLVLEIPVFKQMFPKNHPLAQVDFANAQEFRTTLGIETYHATVGCKAYVIDEHWVMAGATCLWNARQEIYYHGKTQATGLVEPDMQSSLKINGEEIKMEGNFFTQPSFTLLPHVILVRIPENTRLSKQIKELHKVRLLAFLGSKTPRNLAQGKFYINSSRFGINAVRERELGELQPSDSFNSTVTVQDKWTHYAGLSTDPIFFVKDFQVFWFGVNDGATWAFPDKKWDGQSSNAYYYFNLSDMNFIENVLKENDPLAFKRVKRLIYYAR